MSFWDDALSGLLDACNATFGEPILYTRGSLSAEITGIFDSHGVGEGQSLGNVMQVGININDLAEMLVDENTKEPLAGDGLVIRGKKYLISGPPVMESSVSAILTVARIDV